MLSLSLLALSYTIPPLGNVLNVKDFGAKGDGTLHVPYYRSGTSKNWYYAARAA